ncbi:hypothetical protein COW36_10430 [bacterium (Candidatus Blackallbacteria) CG17_big_fil_post_rev_8_21_14_2_50_48_46]|uniref:J domain-containing protein n=1 Tax=bacterium (Candidatus Blackallbacteria) CG17_big_fil_post_rev_8_21_14_2_50_48_46 TaxID=2014261 RepID=A0A2M7G579_9BACT|nr:MAG: hypothetical protein COW64_20205 [bacterium (Candidatus Blackallbacteria) CG18_big_fil_WC_8_21_14_2_50_49_26]PIW17048.1 MAG: hypothetical protein COW36_10430 [bacterium (Candidatus Blackallbacteria) CG17_big_fil_post_rev_8_21_14_2_50_48_46]PIW47717.1 MAG: hypothetical protein COW20_11790 [bacterium (Candidatus Blackallbacteria) CG13_big_fil_rev_8_21_14_2_50_49_14]
MSRRSIKTLPTGPVAKDHVRTFVRHHGRRLPDHLRHRLEMHSRALSLHLTPELQLQELQDLLEQFADEEKYLSPELRTQFETLSESNRRVFVRELKLLAEMKPTEREAYLASMETFRHTELGLADCTPAMRQALQILGLNHPCSLKEIKQAYRVQAKKLHPDQGGHHDRFLRLQQAYLTALKAHRLI